ncbi:DNA-binding protein, excisionase family [Streptomyces xiamenensis]|uniref:DNA-binding protein, excisionase family n=1 Tax=Streptomyces xiamenensis TaxID=408015 RepID=A0A0F7CNI9_9ACTN|nr:DNA-binding protein, excisionase family [Streptomyces xiamenensis]
MHLETGAGDEALVLPRPVAEMFASMLAALANGQGIQIMPVDAELTTQQAADMLNVSRPYLIGLLESGEIRFRLVGRHRRIRFADLHQYLREDDARRKETADELMELDQDLGLL